MLSARGTISKAATSAAQLRRAVFLFATVSGAAGLFSGARAAETDSYLPWEGGSAYYKQWPNNRLVTPGLFPISVWLQDPDKASEYKAIGVNQFVGLWHGPNENALSALAAAGMAVFADQTPGAIRSLNRGTIQGWFLMDEPDNAQDKPGGGWGPCILPPLLVNQYRKMKQRDSTRPVLLNLGQAVANQQWPGRGEVCSGHDEHYPQYIRAADIVAYDVYPINGKLPLWYVGKGIDRLRKWAEYKKPVWNWIETTSVSGGPKPTPAEVRSEVWMSIIHGSLGVGYFCHSFTPPKSDAALLDDPEMRQAVAAINRQITSLAPVLNSPSVGKGVTVDSSNKQSPIDLMLKRYSGASYLFAVGGRPGGLTTASFRLRDCPNLTAAVLGESRVVAVTGGMFHDRFSDYEVHIYKLPWSPGASK